MSGFISVLSFMFIFQTSAGIGIYSHLELHKEAYIKHVSGRVRRDVANRSPEFPQKAAFAIETDEGLFLLKLKNANRRGPKGVMHVNNKFGRHTYIPEKKPNYEFYVGENVQASIVMICKMGVRPCSIFGQYSTEADTYLIDTNTTVLHATKTIKHQLYKAELPAKGTFRHDAGIPTSWPPTPGKSSQSVKPAMYFADDMKKPDIVRKQAGGRWKRGSHSHRYIVESVWTIDTSTYRYWYAFANNDFSLAMDLMYTYYEHIAVTITQRFESYDDHSYVFYPILDVWTDPLSEAWISDNLFTRSGETGLHATYTLYDYAIYVYYNREYYPGADHFLLITRHQLGDPADGFGVLGNAFLWKVGWNAMCSRFSTPAVATARTLVNGLDEDIFTHEFAHSMGTPHDERNDSNCNQNYTMYPEASLEWEENVADHRYKFSPCSQAYLGMATDNYIEKYGYDSCLENNVYATDTELDRIHEAPLLGEQLSLNEQCKMYHGSKSSRILKGDLSNICHEGFYCTDTKLPSTIALSGTPCGEDKWCYYGLCEDKPASTSSTTSTNTP